MVKSQIKKIIDNFQIGRIIGSGTFGKVRQGIHIPTKQKVAIKILQKKRIKNKKDIQRIRTQLEILKQINHPNILKLLSVKQTQKEIFIITQLATGEQLYQKIIKKGHLSQQQSRKYFIQLYKAVRFLQSKNISHRDIKPQNIIVDGENLKLIDFGLSARFNQSNFMMSTSCGSPCYAAPEMVLGKRYDCRKIDIWAMGVTLYAMLAGKLPFQHQNTHKLYQLIETSDYQQISGLPSYLSLLIRAMIQKDPSKRIVIEQISDNIWIKDDLEEDIYCQDTQKNLDSKILTEMAQEYNIPMRNLLAQITGNSLSDLSTNYYLKSKGHSSDHSTQWHSGPFHLQFVFRNTSLLEFFLEKHELKYEWKGDHSKKGREIIIEGQTQTIKRLKDLPQLLYLPLNPGILRHSSSSNNSTSTNFIHTQSQIDKACIQTF